MKNKQYPAAGRLRVNMGNIYYEQKKYPNAIKMYRMALDQVPNTSKEVGTDRPATNHGQPNSAMVPCYAALCSLLVVLTRELCVLWVMGGRVAASVQDLPQHRAVVRAAGTVPGRHTGVRDSHGR